jgi:L-lactate dehydrogenase (cytochrome)
MIMSGSSLIRLEEVAAAAPGSWLQAYLPGDEPAIEALIDRVASAGFETLVVTVDTQAAANRENNVRAGFSTPMRPSLGLAMEGIAHPRWLAENNYVERGAPILSPNVERDFSDRGHPKALAAT